MAVQETKGIYLLRILADFSGVYLPENGRDVRYSGCRRVGHRLCHFGRITVQRPAGEYPPFLEQTRKDWTQV